MTKSVEKTKDVDCADCGAVVTLSRVSKAKAYIGECDGCETKIQSLFDQPLVAPKTS